MTSSSAEYYRTHPAAMERNAAYDTKFESSPAQKAKRRELSRHNDVHDKKYGASSRNGMDASHTKEGIRYNGLLVKCVLEMARWEVEIVNNL